MTPPLQAALAERQILPKEQLLNMGGLCHHVTAEHLVSRQNQYEVDWIGPGAADPRWQAQFNTGFGTADFTIDWQAKRTCCPKAASVSNGCLTTMG